MSFFKKLMRAIKNLFSRRSSQIKTQNIMANTLFTYSFQPPSVFIASTLNMTLVIENPVDGSPIKFSGAGPRGDEIQITFPVGSGDSDLVESLSFTTNSLTTGFTIGKTTGDTYSIQSPNGSTLQPGSKIEVQFTNVVINGKTADPPSTVDISIQEYIGSSDGKTAVSIKKLPQELGVIAWLVPPVVGLYEEATLNWQSMGGVGVQIIGFPTGSGTKEFPVSGDPPYFDHTQVTVGSTTVPQRTYTAKVYTSDQKHKEEPVTITQNPPVINYFKGDKSGTIAVDASLILTWDVLFSAGTSLSSVLNTYPNPTSPKVVYPGKELSKAYFGNYASMPDALTYHFDVQGFEKPAKAELTIELAPVELAFFKFNTMDGTGKLSGVTMQTNPKDWSAVESVLGNDLNTLTIWQPGGSKKEYYLGDENAHPQIQYFNGTDKKDGSFELQWVTKNLKTLTLNPGGYSITGDDIAKGSKTIQAKAGDIYTLLGTDENGETVPSVLVLVGA